MMMQNMSKFSGFRSHGHGDDAGKSRRVVYAELAAIIGLTIATVIAATVVSVGIARASVVDGVIDNDGRLFVIAMIMGLASSRSAAFRCSPARASRVPEFLRIASATSQRACAVPLRAL